MAGYLASKAAAHSLTKVLRPVLGAQGISVHGVWRIDPKALKRAFCGGVAA
jgi:NAD(P)-dependent dehydrogenase (short-subunit alcohol dehydrogenase family)